MAVLQRDVAKDHSQGADIAIHTHVPGRGRIRKSETDHDFVLVEMGCRDSD